MRPFVRPSRITYDRYPPTTAKLVGVAARAASAAVRVRAISITVLNELDGGLGRPLQRTDLLRRHRALDCLHVVDAATRLVPPLPRRHATVLAASAPPARALLQAGLLGALPRLAARHALRRRMA